MILVFSLLSLIWDGFVTFKLWRWFAEPAGAPHLRIAHVMGLALLVLISVPVGTSTVKTGEDLVAKLFMRPLLFLALGFVYKIAAGL